MQSIDAFFDHKARMLSCGDIPQACAGLQLPTTIYFGDQALFVKDEAMLLTLMAGCLHALHAQGYSKTTQAITQRSDLPHGGMCVTVQWAHLGQTGERLRDYDLTYYMKPDNGSWKIGLVETRKRLDQIYRDMRLCG